MLNVQCNIFNYYKSEVSRASNVNVLHCMNFCTEFINSLWIFSCDVCTDLDVHIHFYGIWIYSQILSKVNKCITGWKNIFSTSEAWNLQQWFGLIFLFVFQIQILFIIHLFVSEFYPLLKKENYYHNIQVKEWTHTLPLSFSFGYTRKVNTLKVVYTILHW